MTSSFLNSTALATLCGVRHTDNLASVHRGLVSFGREAGLDRPHRLVAYLAQISHESASFKYDREIWGPTAAQKRYDTRTDLGNTAAADGDGKKNMGRTAMQITGGHNIREFRDWCREYVDQTAPNFCIDPDLMNTDPWEGLGPIWYWMTRNLNTYADTGDVKGVTKRINGGYNGLEDREARYDAIAMRTLGYPLTKTGIRQFQTAAGFTGSNVDGVLGPRTRVKLHDFLAELPAVSFSAPSTSVAAPIGFVESIIALLKSLVTKGK